MADYRYHNLLADQIEKRIAELKEGLVTGNCTMEMYQRHCGMIQGMRDALRFSEDIKKLILGESQ